jgi:flagellar protein FlgJ
MSGPPAPCGSSVPLAARDPAAAAPRDPRAELRRAAHELESVFLGQLFQAMRATVPKSGLLEASPGQEIFTSMLDDQVAVEAARRMQRGLGEVLYRQLARRLPADTASSEGATPSCPTVR